MPPTRQHPPTTARNGTPTTGTRTGSLLSKAVAADQLTDDWVHMILYGRNRIGKTTLACQFPKPLLLVSIEPSRTGGARSVRKVPGVKVLRYNKDDGDLRDTADIMKLGQELLTDQTYKTVVLDSGTSLDEIMLAEVCGWNQTADLLKWGKVSQDQYMERTERVRKVLRPYLDFPRHLVVVCNEKDHNPPEGRKGSLTRGMQAE